MLKLIFDTNIFRNSEPECLEDYKLSSRFEKILSLINKYKIQDVQLCMNEVALLEYIEQIGNWYQTKIVDEYERIFNAIKYSYPAQKMYFQSKNDFVDDYKFGIVNYLQKNNINIVNIIPSMQDGGICIADVVEKTIKNIAPFDKIHNRDLKDAFISESNNSNAKNAKNNLYVFITENKDDYKDNKLSLVQNYKIEFVNQKESMIEIFKIIKNNGSYIDDEVYYREYINIERFHLDIKSFFEESIIGGDFYLDDPILKKYDDKHYYVDYEISEEGYLILKFFIMNGQTDNQCGIVYDISNKKPQIIKKYINYIEDSEEIYYDEF